MKKYGRRESYHSFASNQSGNSHTSKTPNAIREKMAKQKQQIVELEAKLKDLQNLRKLGNGNKHHLRRLEDNNLELRGKVRRLEIETEEVKRNFRRELKDLENDNRKLEKELKEFKDKHKKVSFGMDGKSGGDRDVEKMRREKDKAKRQLKEFIDQANIDRMKLEEKNRGLQYELKTIRRSHTKEMAGLNSEISKLSFIDRGVDSEALQKEIDGLKDDNKRLQREVSEFKLKEADRFNGYNDLKDNKEVEQLKSLLEMKDVELKEVNRMLKQRDYSSANFNRTAPVQQVNNSYHPTTNEDYNPITEIESQIEISIQQHIAFKETEKMLLTQEKEALRDISELINKELDTVDNIIRIKNDIDRYANTGFSYLKESRQEEKVNQLIEEERIDKEKLLEILKRKKILLEDVSKFHAKNLSCLNGQVDERNKVIELMAEKMAIGSITSRMDSKTLVRRQFDRGFFDKYSRNRMMDLKEEELRELKNDIKMLRTKNDLLEDRIESRKNIMRNKDEEPGSFGGGEFDKVTFEIKTEDEEIQFLNRQADQNSDKIKNWKRTLNDKRKDFNDRLEQLDYKLQKEIQQGGRRRGRNPTEESLPITGYESPRKRSTLNDGLELDIDEINGVNEGYLKSPRNPRSRNFSPHNSSHLSMDKNSIKASLHLESITNPDIRRLEATLRQKPFFINSLNNLPKKLLDIINENEELKYQKKKGEKETEKNTDTIDYLRRENEILRRNLEGSLIKTDHLMAKELNELKANLSVIEDKSQDLRLENDDLRKQLNKLRRERNQLRVEQDADRQKDTLEREDLESDLKLKSATLKKMEAKAKSLDLKNKMLAKQLEDLEAASVLKGEHDGMKRDYKNAIEDLYRARDEAKQAKEENTDLKLENSKLKNVISLNDLDFKKLENSFKLKEKENEYNKNKLDEYDGKLKKAIENNRKELNELQTREEDLQFTKKDLENMLNLKEKEIQHLKQKISDDDSISKREHEGLRKYADNLQEKQSENEEKIAELKGTLENKNNELLDNIRKKSELDNTIKELRGQVKQMNNLKNEKARLSDDLDNRMAHIQKQNAELDELRPIKKKLDKILKENEHLKTEVERLEEELENAKSAKRRLNEERIQMLDSVNKLRFKKEELEVSNESKVNIIGKLQVKAVTLFMELERINNMGLGAGTSKK